MLKVVQGAATQCHGQNQCPTHMAHPNPTPHGNGGQWGAQGGHAPVAPMGCVGGGTMAPAGLGECGWVQGGAGGAATGWATPCCLGHHTPPKGLCGPLGVALWGHGPLLAHTNHLHILLLATVWGVHAPPKVQVPLVGPSAWWPLHGAWGWAHPICGTQGRLVGGIWGAQPPHALVHPL